MRRSSSFSSASRRRARVLLRCVHAGLIGVLLATPFGVAGATELRPGDVLTAGETFFYDGNEYQQLLAVMHVDPVTQYHTYLSGAGVGTGPEFVNATGIAVQGNSTVFVADGARILSIDPATGDRTVFSGEGVGAGTPLSSTHGLWLRDDHSLLVVDRLAQSVLLVDLASGDRTVISSPTVGAGPTLLKPYDVTTTLDGRILVASYGAMVADDEYHAFVMAIDPTTGDRSVFSDATHGGGPGYVSALGITRRANGNILVTDNWPARIYELDPATGEQTLFHATSPSAPNDGQYVSPVGIVEGPDGTVYFTETTYGLMRIDTASGWARTIYGEDGTYIGWSEGITVVQVPEPTGMALAVVGGGLLVAAARRRKRRVRMNSL